MIAEADTYIASSLDEAVLLRPDNLGKYPPISVPDHFKAVASRAADTTALWTKAEDGSVKTWNYR